MSGSVKTSAIVLSAGSGSRMKSDVKKQYMSIMDRPLLYYSLKTFQDSFVDEIILVVSKADEEYVKREIVEAYAFSKVKAIVYGGAQRYHSVANGLAAVSDDVDYVFIHDGARPVITKDILNRALDEVKGEGTAVVGMPSKDTIKIVDETNTVINTPNRESMWIVQTPQVFERKLIKDAYTALIRREEEFIEKGIKITDDAMVVEFLTGHKVKMVEGSYENIKVTTPEDIAIVTGFLKNVD